MPPSEIVLITGASSGIGLELARAFARDRSDLVLVARRADKLEALARELKEKHGIDVRVVPKDLARPESPAELFEALRNRGVAVDVLVNNAGFGMHGRFAELDAAGQLEMVQLNVVALTALTRLFLPGMIARRKGGVLNVASTAAFQPGPMLSAYYATKAFVLSLTEGISEELRGTGVRATCLCPGPTTTEFIARADMAESKLFQAGAMSAERAARKGHRAFRRGKVVAIPGIVNSLGAFATRLSPRWLARKVTMILNG
ncbi:MAG: SDR family oxidoreductase [Planctomycetes bacterium]|nr:SDR family oxidoreductase [Planctomycetota bacterium]